MSRPETSLLKLNIVSYGLVILAWQLIGGSEFWKYVGMDDARDPSLNIIGKSIKPINLLMRELNIL